MCIRPCAPPGSNSRHLCGGEGRINSRLRYNPPVDGEIPSGTKPSTAGSIDINPLTRLDSAAHVTVAWEPLLRPVPVHLLEQTRCYSLPRSVAIFARRTHRGQSARLTALRCPNPWRVQAQGSDDNRETYTLPVSLARTWETRVTTFTIALDLRDTISAYDNGIYTIGVWGTVDAQATLLSLYSVVGGDRPDLRW